MAAPNLFSPTTATGKTAVQAITGSATAIVSGESGKVKKINSLRISNVDGVNPADVTVDYYRSSTAYRIGYLITVQPKSTLTVISRDDQIYIEEADTLRLTASASSDLEAVCSYEEIS